LKDSHLKTSNVALLNIETKKKRTVNGSKEGGEKSKQKDAR